MTKLLIENQLRKRATFLAGWWKSQGVSVSAIAFPAYWALRERLREGTASAWRPEGDLLTRVTAFVAGSNVLTIVGWALEAEPLMFISTDKLLAKLSLLDRIYPDGFILVRDAEAKALIADIDNDEKRIEVCLVDLSAPTL